VPASASCAACRPQRPDLRRRCAAYTGQSRQRDRRTRRSPTHPGQGNQPTPHAQLKTLPWAQIPIGHQPATTATARSETRTVKAVTLTTPVGIGFPNAEQAIRITRIRTITSIGKTSRETAYLTISLPATDA
jgi:hypothetical protein